MFTTTQIPDEWLQMIPKYRSMVGSLKNAAAFCMCDQKSVSTGGDGYLLINDVFSPFCQKGRIHLGWCRPVAMIIFLTPTGPLGRLDRTDKFQQNQRLEDRFRSGCDQPEGRRLGKGSSAQFLCFQCIFHMSVVVYLPLRRDRYVRTHRHTFTHQPTRLLPNNRNPPHAHTHREPSSKPWPPSSLLHVAEPPWIIYPINNKALSSPLVSWKLN